MLPADGYIYMYMPQAFKKYSISCSTIFLAKRIVAMSYGVTHLKKMRNILTRVQLTVAHERPCCTEPVNTFKKQRRTLSCILNKAGDAVGVRKKLHNAE